MAKASIELISILRNTAKRIASSNEYQWGHMGACNCGFLAQEVTHLNKSVIHSRAMQGSGDWNEQLNDYCTTSGLPLDEIIHQLLNTGFDIDDLKHLERLSSTQILRQLPFEKRNLKQNIKSDVVIYFNAWITFIENKLAEKISLPREVLTGETTVAI
jgi:hypothetical protein